MSVKAAAEVNPYQSPIADCRPSHGPHNCWMCWWELNWRWAVFIAPLVIIWMFVYDFYYYLRYVRGREEYQ